MTLKNTLDLKSHVFSAISYHQYLFKDSDFFLYSNNKAITINITSEGVCMHVGIGEQVG